MRKEAADGLREVEEIKECGEGGVEAFVADHKDIKGTTWGSAREPRLELVYSSKQVLTLRRICFHGGERTRWWHTAAGRGLAKACPESGQCLALTINVTLALLPGEPAAVQPMVMPALEASAEYGGNCPHWAANNVNRPMAFTKTVERYRICEVLEYSIVINVA